MDVEVDGEDDSWVFRTFVGRLRGGLTVGMESGQCRKPEVMAAAGGGGSIRYDE